MRIASTPSLPGGAGCQRAAHLTPSWPSSVVARLLLSTPACSAAWEAAWAARGSSLGASCSSRACAAHTTAAPLSACRREAGGSSSSQRGRNARSGHAAGHPMAQLHHGVACNQHTPQYAKGLQCCSCSRETAAAAALLDSLTVAADSAHAPAAHSQCSMLSARSSASTARARATAAGSAEASRTSSPPPAGRQHESPTCAAQACGAAGDALSQSAQARLRLCRRFCGHRCVRKNPQARCPVQGPGAGTGLTQGRHQLLQALAHRAPVPQVGARPAGGQGGLLRSAHGLLCWGSLHHLCTRGLWAFRGLGCPESASSTACEQGRSARRRGALRPALLQPPRLRR